MNAVGLNVFRCILGTTHLLTPCVSKNSCSSGSTLKDVHHKALLRRCTLRSRHGPPHTYIRKVRALRWILSFLYPEQEEAMYFWSIKGCSSVVLFSMWSRSRAEFSVNVFLEPCEEIILKNEMRCYAVVLFHWMTGRHMQCKTSAFFRSRRATFSGDFSSVLKVFVTRTTSTRSQFRARSK